MAFDRKNFNVQFLNQSKTPSKYSYITTENMTAVTASGYFNELYDILKVNDMIEVTSNTQGTPVIEIVKVTSNASKVVAVAEGTALA